MKLEIENLSDEFATALALQVTKEMMLAAAVVVEQAKDNLSIPGPPASQVGESPRKRTTREIEPVVIRRDKGDDGPAVLVQTDPKYWRLNFHELNGRPWLLPAAMNTVSEQGRAMTDG